MFFDVLKTLFFSVLCLESSLLNASDLLGNLGASNPFQSIQNADSSVDSSVDFGPELPIDDSDESFEGNPIRSENEFIEESALDSTENVDTIQKKFGGGGLKSPAQQTEDSDESDQTDTEDNKKKSSGKKAKSAPENIKLIEIDKALDLKKKHTGDIFYLSMDLVHPPVTIYSKEAFEHWYTREQPGHPSLPYNKNRSARDTNIPFKVVLAPNHAYVVFVDTINEFLKDQKAGAKAIPVEIIQDDSDLYSETIFWNKLEKDGQAWLKDIDGKEQKPLTHFNQLKDEPLLGALDKAIVAVSYARTPPHSRVYAYVEYPAALRIDSSTSKFLLYQIAPSIKKFILADDKRRNGQCNFDNETMALPDLMPLLNKNNEVIDKKRANRLRFMLNEAFSEGDFQSIKHFQDNMRLLRDEDFQPISKINFNNLTGISKQILVVSKG